MSEKDPKPTPVPTSPPVPPPAFVRWGSWGWFPIAEAGGAASTLYSWLAHPVAVAGTACLVVGLLVGAGALFVVNKVASPTPVITLPATLAAQTGRLAEIDAVTNGKEIRWEATAPDYDVVTSSTLPKAAFVFPANGQYIVTARTAIGSKIAQAQCAVTVGNVPPGPGPIPPGPVPPVPPVPPIPPAPIPDPGFRVLVVLETADLSKLPPAQITALNSQEVRAYLNSKCVLGPDGKQKEWRVWDKDVDPSAESALWQTAFKRASGKTLPWIIISNGTTGFEGPVPVDTASLLTLLKKYGGD